jgi:hypothetical protein
MRDSWPAILLFGLAVGGFASLSISGGGGAVIGILALAGGWVVIRKHGSTTLGNVGALGFSVLCLAIFVMGLRTGKMVQLP